MERVATSALRLALAMLSVAAACSSDEDSRGADADVVLVPIAEAGVASGGDASSIRDALLDTESGAFVNDGGFANIDAEPRGSFDAESRGDALATDAHDTEADASGFVRATRVLAFTRTLGYRHDAIPIALAALAQQAEQRGWTLAASEDPALFSDPGLADYDVVAFVHTTGDVLDDAQQAALTRFIQRGKGWVGVHSASDAEYDWPWYGELVGAYFLAHPAIQTATLRVEQHSHPATAQLGDSWTRSDEWYAFRTNPRGKVNVLLALDETSYEPGTAAMGGDHPIAWYHAYDGGRAFYTALGHTLESWSEPAFLAHVAGAIEWAAGRE